MKNYNIPRSMSIAVNIYDTGIYGFGDDENETPSPFKIVVYPDDPKNGGVQTHRILETGYVPANLTHLYGHEDEWLFYNDAKEFLSIPEIRQALNEGVNYA